MYKGNFYRDFKGEQKDTLKQIKCQKVSFMILGRIFKGLQLYQYQKIEYLNE